MNNRYGPPVEGNDFFGRTNELAFVWEKLKEGNHFIFAAPRRVGKSSFGKKLLAIATKEQWKVLDLNLEGIASEKEFLKEFIKKLESQSWWSQAKSSASNTIQTIIKSIKSVGIQGAKIELDWGKKEDLYSDLKNLIESLGNCLIMMDELTVYLNQLEEESEAKSVRFFLNWLRSFRQESNTKVRWIFCSSISIENYAQAKNLSYTINDISNFEIEAFDYATSIELLKKLEENKKYSISQEQKEYILEKIGWLIPYFIQLYFSKIDFEINKNKETITTQLLNAIYSELIEHNPLNTWVERLSFYKENVGWAKKTLKLLCQHKKGLSKQKVLNHFLKHIPDVEDREETIINVLRMLINDGYLIRQKEMYSFRSPIIRDYWYQKFVI